MPRSTGARYPSGSPSTSRPTCPFKSPWQKVSGRSVYCRSGKAVLREPVTYSSTLAGVSIPSISIAASRCSMRRTSAGSVRSARKQTVTAVWLRSPTVFCTKRSCAERRWRRRRLVLMRMVSVKASFAPLTVFSDSGADGPRRVSVFVSKQSAAPVPGKTTAQ